MAKLELLGALDVHAPRKLRLDGVDNTAPVVSSTDMLKVLTKELRYTPSLTKERKVILTDDRHHRVSVPINYSELHHGTVQRILDQADLDVTTLLVLLKKV